ncbi:hypothetical protein CDAR_534831 [Caerostris darwini]|uniref:Uncharacterized protein n=1 Tax=Caerostris darwini TaxID=1538125 RepID=A0AAV4MTZ9_9ARAC|nr:hypothetical protein CDAR_534831 [Caerostris darwini]
MWKIFFHFLPSNSCIPQNNRGDKLPPGILFYPTNTSSGRIKDRLGEENPQRADGISSRDILKVIYKTMLSCSVFGGISQTSGFGKPSITCSRARNTPFQ